MVPPYAAIIRRTVKVTTTPIAERSQAIVKMLMPRYLVGYVPVYNCCFVPL